MADPSGFAEVSDRSSDYAAMRLVVEQFVSRVETVTLAKVIAVAGTTLTVQPMVAQVNGAGQTVAQPQITGVPFLRLQGGTNAVIIDPAIGDIGICLFASRDISAVKRTQAAAGPGSLRRHNLSDALYVGGLLNGVPVQFISFLADGIHIHTPNTIFLEGNVVATGTFTSNSHNISNTHTHTNVQPGGGTSGPVS